MFETNRRLPLPAMRLSLSACALLLSTGVAVAQSTGNAAPGTAPMGQSSPAQSSPAQSNPAQSSPDQTAPPQTVPPAATPAATPAASQPDPGPASSSQTGTSAAPGTAPIHSRVVANQITPQRVVTYNERYEIFGGLSFMNGQAGQDIPKRYNMGGGEAMATYWLGKHLGASADYRFEAGTTPVLPNSLGLNRVLAYQNIFSGGAEYRGPKNRYAAVDFHALVGASHGTFSSAINNHPPTGTPFNNATVGLYNDSTTPWGAAGGSIDFNTAPRLAVRLSPDIIFEHFGTETREFVSVSGGVIYRFGNRR